jgi:hypothetical protein
MLMTRKERLEWYVSLGRRGRLNIVMPITSLDQEREIVKECQYELMDIEIEEFAISLKAKREQKGLENKIHTV